MVNDDRALPMAQTDPEGGHGYAHDILGRLVGVDHPFGAAFGDEAYSYDAADRRTSNGAVYDIADRLLEDADYTFAYDDEGRRTSRTEKVGGALTTYEWNVLDQLVALDEGMVRWEYTYDARDLRIRVGNNAGYDERFVYDHNGTVRATFDGAGALTASYLTGFGFGEVLARVEPAGEGFALRDRLGSTVADGYGVRAVDAAAVVPFGYTGHAEDPTGLVWGRARYLTTTEGGWLGEDPVFGEPRYCYLRGAPDSAVDPTGRSAAIEYFATKVVRCSAGSLAALVGGGIGAKLAGRRGLSPDHAAAAAALGCAYGAFGGVVPVNLAQGGGILWERLIWALGGAGIRELAEGG